MGKREEAQELFLKGYNCSQAVAGAYAKEMGLDFDTVMKMVSSLGGGMGRMREVCGAVSGMFLVAGYFYGYKNPENSAEKKAHYERIQYLAAKFKEETGSIICRELLGVDGQDQRPVPSERTKEYYNKRPCVEMVGLAVDVLENYRKEHPKSC